jgi:putative transposase
MVWATKDRKPLMNKEHKDAICKHIREYAPTKSIHVLNVNGWQDHLHCLVSLSPDQNVLTIVGLIKGESSFWAGKNLKMKEKFGWQDDYFAVSVSESQFPVINRYISNQEEHHKKKTFQQEYDEFMAKYKFQ